MVRPIRLTTGYDPEALRSYPAWRSALADALVNPPSSYVRYATWTYNTATAEWLLVGGAPVGLDTLVTTPRGVMGINVHWPTRLNDAGYLLPYDSSLKRVEKVLYLFDAAPAGWERLSNRGPTPQNLYEMTSLAYGVRVEILLDARLSTIGPTPVGYSLADIEDQVREIVELAPPSSYALFRSGSPMEMVTPETSDSQGLLILMNRLCLNWQPNASASLKQSLQAQTTRKFSKEGQARRIVVVTTKPQENFATLKGSVDNSY